MGLDVVYYSKIEEKCKTTDAHEDVDIDIVNADCFDYQLGSLKKELVYKTTSVSEAGSFRSGSYGSYNQWRKELATMLGYDIERVWEEFDNIIENNGDNYEYLKMKPFYELISFSDCEGVIGSEISKKLYDDFLKFDEHAQKIKIHNFYEHYKYWTNAFKVASKNGLVLFS